MATQVFNGAARALRGFPIGTQSQMYQQHFRSTPTRHSGGGHQLRQTVHRVTDSRGTVYRFTVISSQRAGQAVADLIVMNSADAAAAAAYIRGFIQGRRQ